MSEMRGSSIDRTLGSDIPELKPFLKPGMKALDVGCGPGTITLGVVDSVYPGTAVGIDPASDFIDIAQKRAAQAKHPENIRFQVGDTHHLDFPDETFDVVFSHTVLHFIIDPVKAIEEQKRVTKKGGWLIASGVRDLGGIGFIHPPSPNWEKVYEACFRYWDANLTKYRESGKDPEEVLKELYGKSRVSTMLHGDVYAGRKCLDWFNKAGLSEFQIEIQGRMLYNGHRDKPPSTFDFLVIEEPVTDYQKRQVELIKGLQSGPIDSGLLDEETLKLATEEARAWYKDPGAFRFFPEFFVAGKKAQA